ncbi:MAG TPA: TIGR00266 family protein [Thermomicrobiales bacterium]|nr:TIGR00266 family protein [Thermomicrobiales bacterium]
MQTEILYAPAYALTRLTLAPREAATVEAGAMVSMSSDMEIKTSSQGGFLKALKRSTLGGESFFVNTFTASEQGGDLTVASSLPGDMLVLDLQNEVYKVQAGGFIASGQGINVDTKWGGSRSFFGGDGSFFMLSCSGTGPLVLASYGALHKITLAAGQRYTVDSGHVVAFTNDMGFSTRRVGNWKSTILGGEGLVVDLTGPGDLFMQTRSQPAFIGWLTTHLPSSQAG